MCHTTARPSPPSRRRDVVAAQERGKLGIGPLLRGDLALGGPLDLATAVVDLPGPPARDLARHGRAHRDSVAVGVLYALVPAVLDGAATVAPPHG